MAWLTSDRAFLLPKEDIGQSHPDVTFGAAHDAGQEFRDRERLMKDLRITTDKRDMVISFEEVLEAFRNRKDGVDVDEDRLQRLYLVARESADRRQVTWSLMIDTLFKERKQVVDHLANVQQSIRDTESHIVYCEGELRACVNSSTAGVNEEERLVVQVLYLKFLGETPWEVDSRAYRVSLECNGHTQETASRSKLDSQIFCNQVFNFRLPHPDGNLELSLIAVNPRSSDYDAVKVVAQGQLDLGPMADQSRHEITVPLAGENLDVDITLVLQWLKSKISFYEKHLHKYQEERASLLREEEHLQQEQINFDRTILSTNNVLGRNTGATALAILTAAVTRPDEFVNWTVERMMFSVHATDFDRAVQVMLMGFIALSCLGSFTRALYLDTMIGAAAFWCNLDAQRRWTTSKYTQVLGALIVSEIFDCIWIYYNFQIIKLPESGLAHVTKVMALICMCWKVVLFFFMAKCRYDLQVK